MTPNPLTTAVDPAPHAAICAACKTLNLTAAADVADPMDEVGYVQLDTRGAELLFQIITAREERASIVCASNAPFSEWGQIKLQTRGQMN